MPNNQMSSLKLISKLALLAHSKALKSCPTVMASCRIATRFLSRCPTNWKPPITNSSTDSINLSKGPLALAKILSEWPQQGHKSTAMGITSLRHRQASSKSLSVATLSPC